ncbi:hypothetical protein R3I93_021751 [Phoxinus phoxinus]|uniref:Uncharacterized protein n=1 Tax=Phoxinus phoxinus TaxID=58324 RepID=A0AAN9C6G3_9TELE
MDHGYALAAGTSQTPPRKRKRSDEKREKDRLRQKNRVNIGAAYSRWKALKVERGLKNDAEVARYLLDRVCGEHLSQDQFSAPPRKRGRPRKSTAAPKTEPSPDPYSNDQCDASEDSLSTDHSQPSSDRQSDSESQPSPDPQPTNVPSHLPYKPDKQAQPERQNDGSDLDIEIGSIQPSYSFAGHSSSSSTITEEDNAMNWEEIKDEMAQTAQRLEERLNVMRSLTDGALEPISMTRGKDDQDEVKWVVNKSSLTGLFRSCHQCGEPVLEFKTLTSGSLVRIQWECSKGHLMWLFPNHNPT